MYWFNLCCVYFAQHSLIKVDRQHTHIEQTITSGLWCGRRKNSSSDFQLAAWWKGCPVPGTQPRGSGFTVCSVCFPSISHICLSLIVKCGVGRCTAELRGGTPWTDCWRQVQWVGDSKLPVGVNVIDWWPVEVINGWFPVLHYGGQICQWAS